MSQNLDLLDLRCSRRRVVVAGGAAAVAAVVTVPAALLPRAAHAQFTLKEGKDFRAVQPPQPVESGQRIEVLEFFQYSCPHCFTFTPDLEKWRKSAGDEVDYRRIPINWDNSTLNHTKLYYALEALGKLDSMHEKVFSAFHNGKRRLLDLGEITDFVGNNGIDKKQFTDTFNSFTVATKTNRAGQIWRAYKIDGTPSLGVDGKFVTAPSMVGTRDGGIAALTALVQRARSERSAKKS
jgi:protein dithiol oxidoreductase (disulfide-forming)